MIKKIMFAATGLAAASCVSMGIWASPWDIGWKWALQGLIIFFAGAISETF